MSRKGAVRIPDEENNDPENSENTQLSFMEFEKTEPQTSESLAFSLKETINYGRFHILFKYGDFPVFLFPRDKTIPVCFLAFILFARIFLSPWSEAVFETEWIRTVIWHNVNIFVIIFLYWMFTNPGMAGFNIGSKSRERKGKG